MKKIAEGKGIKTLFVVNPVLYDPGKEIVFTDTRYASPEGILKFDIDSVFKKREKADELFLDDVRPFNFHLTAKGHKILAEEIYNFLINNDVLEDIDNNGQ